ncbi:MAG: isoamylase early set domain-containing protein [Halothiobacillaceae bacterium]|jgi:1,4-alpha-glucan branching enzyme|nr:isoamylase early set domain-containing protein [Halothiobacillaceae bacterium]MDY0049815.1 isoamylase early set domain-containing protein [Halothiobacillaceae bacterium]
MSLVKKPLKSRPVCKVTFTVSGETVGDVPSVHLAGDFNDWSTETHPLKRQKDGSWTTTLDLDKDGRYEFRYYLGEERWENDEAADEYTPSPHGCHNSVVTT